MTPLQLAHRWLDVLAQADYDAWETIAAKDLVIHTPYAPPGFPKVSQGRDVALAMARQYGAILKTFQYLDVELHTTDDPALIMGTARSEATTASGRRYANQYCVIMRVSAGKLIEYTEYFDPQRIVDAAAEEGAK